MLLYSVLRFLLLFKVTALVYSESEQGTGVSCNEFTKEGDDVISQCPYVRHTRPSRRRGQTLDYCRREACKFGANVFNFLPAAQSATGLAQCQPRFCDRLGLMPIQTVEGWDVWRRHMFGSCRKMGFRREFRKSAGVYSNCAHLGMPEVTTFQECMEKTCELNGTVFNFRTSQRGAECAIKLCDPLGIHLVTYNGGWNVYHSQIMRKRCEDRFLKLYDKSIGVASSCVLRGWRLVASAAQCAQLACERRANVYNYKDRGCYVESCRSPVLKIMDARGWQLYTSSL